MLHIMITGGMGYIGSNLCKELLIRNYKVSIIDNLSNSQRKDFSANFYDVDLRNKDEILNAFISAGKIDIVIHIAGFKSVSESVVKPLLYYSNNVLGTINLLEVMDQLDIHKLIFSSSATVYGNSASPISEESHTQPTNPYGKSKLIIEQMLKDLKNWSIISLRYFNPSGNWHYKESYPSDNLIPNIINYTEKKLQFKLFGDDYNTPDGTCIRDFIHISDLVEGHISAISFLKKGYEVFNLGTGSGVSVMEVISIWKNLGNRIQIKVCGRRKGDIDTIYADNKKAKEKLGWSPKKNINDILESFSKL